MKNPFKTFPGMKFFPDSKHEFNVCDCKVNEDGDEEIDDCSSGCLLHGDHDAIYESWCFKEGSHFKDVYKFHYFLIILNYNEKIKRDIIHDSNLLLEDELGEAKFFFYDKDALVFVVFNDHYNNIKKRLKKFAKK